jgi:transmembrane sensor
VKELEEHIEAIITRKISGEITSEEQVLLDKWLLKSDDNNAYFKGIEKVYTHASESKNVPAIDVNFEWKKFKKSIQSEEKFDRTNTNWFRIAASFILIASLGYFLWNSSNKSNKVEVIAQNWGEIVTLPDNSTITLNKGAVLTYPKEFSNNNRSVSLSGEAFFEVTRNETKRFIVSLGQSKVEVLGTSFNINAETNNNKTEVVVNTGKVKFSESSNSVAVILTKGEKGTLIKNTNMLTKTFNDDVNVLAWKTRKIVFNDLELDKVIKTINSIYDAQISFSTDIGANCNVTVSFENQSLEAVLSVLKLTLDLEYKKSGDVIEITKSGC